MKLDDSNQDATAAIGRGSLGSPIRRSTFLKAAGAVIGGGLLLGTSTDSRASDTAGTGDVGATAVSVTKIADLTGPGLTTRFRMEATDLGIPVRTPDGRLMFVFGDTFEDACVGCGWWRSPVALYSTTSNLNGGVQWSSA